MTGGTSDAGIDAVVLGEINQRTLVGGTAIETGPIARDANLSPEQLRGSLHRLVARGRITVDGSRASITPEGHADTLP